MGHDVEMSGGVRGSWRLGHLGLESTLGLSRRQNRNFVNLDGVRWDFPSETNAVLDVSATYWPFTSSP
ncbi:MAG: hypothetical protein EXR95_07000 [Gemmatimonadetes bacterium]|nr:hypothetical protein [Gemmatimonadota bacterium]